MIPALLLLAACGNSPEQRHPDHEFRTLVYSQAFGQRFSLPAQGVYPLDKGLEAIALQVAENTHGQLECVVDLYLADVIAFAYPQGNARHMFDATDDGAMFFRDTLSEADSRAWHDRWPPSDVALFRSVELDEKKRRGSAATASVDAFERQIYPGLNWVSFSPVCFTLDPEVIPIKVWLTRAGHEEYVFRTDAPDETHAYSFSIPDALIRHAGPAIRRARLSPITFGPEGRPPKGPHQQYSLPPRSAK